MFEIGVMFFLYVKVIMMKVSYFIVFGYVVRIFYKDVFVKY